MKILPKVFKPIIVSEFAAITAEGTTIDYSNGYDTVSVTVGEAHENGYRDYSITAVNGEQIEAIFTYAELNCYVEEQLFQLIKERYSVADFERICKEKGSLHGIVKIKFHNFRGYPDPDCILINSLIDTAGQGTRGIKVKYEIMGFWGDTIYVMVIAELSAENH